jgi:site-specific DNA recombinase
MSEMIALYERVSTDLQAEAGHSVPEQQDRLEKYCKAMNWKCYRHYTDAGFTGTNINRPALQKLIKDVQAKRIEKVIVYKLDRLSRSQKDTLLLIEDIFLANDCDFISMSENFDTSSPFGRAMIGILAVFAQLEREQIRERMAMGKFARAKEGKFGGSAKVPIGYEYVDGELVTNEFEKMQVIRIFEEYANGSPVAKIARELNESGMIHKYGKWTPRCVRNILEKKTYLGYTPYHDEWYKGSHEAFFSEDLYNRVHSLLRQRTMEHIQKGMRFGKATSYLGGLLYCKQCGGKYAKKTTYGHKREKRMYYVCHSRSMRSKHLVKGECHNDIWRMDDLDDLVFSEIRKLRFDCPKFDEYEEDDRNTNAEVIDAKLSEIDRKLSRLIDAFSASDMPLDLLSEKIRDLNDQRSALQDELDSMSEYDLMPREDAITLVESLDEILDEGDLDKIRAVVCALIERIELDGEDVTIYWRFD